MKILAIDTSSKICSVSIHENNELIKELHSDDEKNHSIKLMPLVDALFKETNLTLNDIDLLACCLGPGSFTGIRIGISTVKAFCDCKNIPVTGVTSLESLAYNIENRGLIASIIDAKNDNVYFGLFEHKNDSYTQIGELVSDNINNVLNIVSNQNSTITFVGNGSALHQNLIKEIIPNSRFAEDNLNLQTSISIGKSAYTKFVNGIFGDSNYINPIYLKKSQAERQLNGEK